MSLALVVRVQTATGRTELQRALPALRAALPSDAEVSLAADTLAVGFQGTASVDQVLALVAALTGDDVVVGSVSGDGTIGADDWLSAAEQVAAYDATAAPSPSVAYWSAAASAAESVNDHTTSLVWLGTGAGAVPADGSFPLLHQRADLLLKQGNHPAAATAWEAAVEVARATGNRVNEAHGLAERANVAYRQGQGTQITAFATQALSAAKVSGDSQAKARALRYVGIGQEFVGDYAAAEATYLELMELQPTGEILAGVCNSLGEISRASERWQEAITWYRRFDEEWRNDHGDEQANVIFLNNMGAALVGAGEYGRATKLLKRAAHHQRRQGHLAMLSETYCFLARAAWSSGNRSAAAGYAVDAYLLATDHAEHEMRALALRVLGQLRAVGESVAVSPDASAESLLRDSISIFESTGKNAEVAHSQAALAAVLSKTGAAEEANELQQQAISTLTGLGQLTAAERLRSQRT